MARKCMLTHKKPQTGNKVSHANNKTKRRFLPNLHSKKVWIDGRWMRFKLSAKAIRIIDLMI